MKSVWFVTPCMDVWHVTGVAAVAGMHDISVEVQGNGYWAQLRVLSCCLKKIRKKLQCIAEERHSVFFGTRVKSLLHGPMLVSFRVLLSLISLGIICHVS